MMINPKKGYRVCLHCGRISTTKMLKDSVNERGTSIKVCPHCGLPEKAKDTPANAQYIFDEYRAGRYFSTVETANRLNVFSLTDRDRQMLKNCYDSYDIPEHLRIY